MDITIYDRILQGLKHHNESISGENYGNAIVGYAPLHPTYPHTIFTEVRNNPLSGFDQKDRLANVGYRAEIWAKTKGNYSKQSIARKVSNQTNKYLTSIGLKLVSKNEVDYVAGDNLYRVILLYNANYDEYRAKIL